jgi:hypothetical protein
LTSPGAESALDLRDGAKMSAQPHESAPAPLTRTEPTIRSIRAGLPPEHRAAFREEIERTPLHEIAKTLADWDLRARALAIPELVAAADRIEDERAGHAQRPRMLRDDEVRAVWPILRH